MSDYTAKAKKAYTDIEKKGGVCTLKQTTEGTLDKRTDTVTGGGTKSVVDYPALFLAPTTKPFQKRFQDGTLSRGRARRLLVPGYKLSLQLQEGDQAVFGGHTWTIFAVKLLDPNESGMVILYDLACER